MEIQDQVVMIETPVFIELEGCDVLTFVEREKNCAIYRVIGFDKEPIKLVDYRQKGLETIDIVLNSSQTEKFPERFCYPAWLRLSESGQEIFIELFDLDDNLKPEIMLWIATNLKEPIPDYDYSFFRINSLTASAYSFVSLFNYHRFQAYFEGIADQMVLKLQPEI